MFSQTILIPDNKLILNDYEKNFQSANATKKVKAQYTARSDRYATSDLLE